MDELKLMKLSDQQYHKALRGVYKTAHIIGDKAEAGAKTWEILRDLALMIDELDRALGREPVTSVDLWCASDILRAEEQTPHITRPCSQEGEP